MVRKRYAWERVGDSRRVRPKGPAPTAGWLVSELAALSGRSRRTIGVYVREGLLAKPAFRGTATRYGRAHLLRLLCVEPLQREGAGTLREVRARLNAMSEGELVARVVAGSPSAAVVVALGLGGEAGASAANDGGSRGVALAGRAPGGDGLDLVGDAWRRVELLPGLELWMAAGASAAVRSVAQRIREYCAGSG